MGTIVTVVLFAASILLAVAILVVLVAVLRQGRRISEIADQTEELRALIEAEKEAEDKKDEQTPSA